MKKLFCDLKTDEEKKDFFASGRGYETGIVAESLQSDLVDAYARCAKYQWQPPKTAPKDGTVFLGNFGYPWWPMTAVWNKPSQQFCAAELHVDLYHGKWNDSHFQNEYMNEKELIGWMPLPEIPESKQC